MVELKEQKMMDIAPLLQRGAIGVLRTDTLYGVVARAEDAHAVERVYDVRGRDAHKPCIVLIAHKAQMFDHPSGSLADFLQAHWPGPVSVVVPSPSAPAHLTRGSGSVAYRLPNSKLLQQLIEATGPLIAPSANLQGESPAADVKQAKAYFGDRVDFYVDGGVVEQAHPSQLWTYRQDKMERLR